MLSTTMQRFGELSLRHKGIFLGIIISTVGLFLPWYSDIDSFNTGVSYLAVTGPGSLIGLSLLLVNMLTTGFVLYAIRFRRDSILPISRRTLEKWHGPIYLFGILLLASIYFHTDFGVNVAEKTVGVGLYLGLAGSFMSSYCGLLMKGKVLDHEKPEVVDHLPYEDNPVLRDQWEKQQEIEQRLLNRSQKGLDTAESTVELDSEEDEVIIVAEEDHDQYEDEKVPVAVAEKAIAEGEEHSHAYAAGRSAGLLYEDDDSDEDNYGHTLKTDL